MATRRFTGFSSDAAASSFLAINQGYPGLRLIHLDPPVYVVERFLTDEECDTLVRCSDGRLATAHVVGKSAQDGRAVINSFGYAQGMTSGRTSRTCTLAKSEVPWLLDKAEALIGVPRSHFELPQVGCYDRGQFYAPHFDGVEPTTPTGRLFLQNGGQRVATLLIYLNTPGDEHGHTAFPALNLALVPRKGARAALLFHPAFKDGRVDPRALHSGEPAGRRKFVAQLWVRQTADRRDAEPSKRVLAPSTSQYQAAPAEVCGGRERGSCEDEEGGDANAEEGLLEPMLRVVRIK